MRILELELTHFGKFHNKTIPFHKGMNVIYGKNEAGKSTIHAFIRAMFFGLSPEDKERLRPWKNEFGFSGKLHMEKAGTCYRLERDFEAETLLLYNETADCELDPSSLPELLAPMTEENFDNILHIGQMQDRFFRSLTSSFRREKEQLEASVQEVKDALLSQEKDIEECKEDILNVAEQMRTLEEEKKKHAEEWEASYQAYEKELKEKEEHVQELFQKLAGASGGKQVQKGSYAAGILFILFAAICAVFYFYCSELNLVGYVPLTMYGAIGFLGLGILVLLVQFISNGCKKKLIALQKEAEMANADYEAFISKKPVPDTEFQADCIKKRHELEDYVHQAKEHMDEVQDCMRENMTLYRSLQQDRRNNNVINLYQQASLFFSELSGNTYREIRMEEDGTLTLVGMENPVPIHQASRGTADQVYFCIRLAAADLLSDEESFPILLDDVFTFYDDDRLHAILKMMKARTNQMILFTCHRRESDILSPDK